MAQMIAISSIQEFRDIGFAIGEFSEENHLCTEEFFSKNWEELRAFFAPRKEEISLIDRKIDAFYHPDPLVAKIKKAWKEMIGYLDQETDRRDPLFARFCELNAYASIYVKKHQTLAATDVLESFSAEVSCAEFFADYRELFCDLPSRTEDLDVYFCMRSEIVSQFSEKLDLVSFNNERFDLLCLIRDAWKRIINCIQDETCNPQEFPVLRETIADHIREYCSMSPTVAISR